MNRALAIALAFAAGSCAADEAQSIGFWKNGTDQVLRVDKELHGTLTQTTTCAAYLSVRVERDPFDNYAIRFEPDQRIYYPPKLRARFAGDSFCSSSGSVPMCRFCIVEQDSMSCESPEQEIVGAGASVTHDCNWQRLASDPPMTVPAGCPKSPQMNCISKTSTRAR